MKKRISNRTGVTLVEVLVSIMIISILTLGLYSLIVLAVKITNDNKNYTSAILIANKKMEMIRNLPYDDVATLGGSPPGNIPQSEIVSEYGREFTVETDVSFYDDPFDDAGTDTIPNDYKLVSITVSWTSNYGPREVSVFSKVIPATEETDMGYGLMKIYTVDANGNPVPNANIHIDNYALSPIVDVDKQSDINGVLSYPVLPAFESYHIRVTKPGYGVDETHDRDAINLNPTKPHLSVISGTKTEESFSIDLLSTLNIHTIQGDLPDNFQVNTDTSEETQNNSRIVIDNSGFIYLVWQDYRQSSASKIYAQKYDSSSNAQWPNTTTPEDQTISTANDTVVPDMLVDCSGDLYISWYDDSVGNKESYLVKRRSSDGNDVWGAEKKINVLADSDDQAWPRIALYDDCVSATSSVVWQDDRNGDWDIYIQVFSDGGVLQFSPEIKVNNTASGDGSDQVNPVVAIDGNGDIYTAWVDDRNGDKDIYYAKNRLDGSQIRQAAANQGGLGFEQSEADIAIDSLDNVYIVWTDNRNGDNDIYAQKFNSAGIALWGANDLRINTDSGSVQQTQPSIAIDSLDNIYITWTDERNNNMDIYSQKYSTAGTALWSGDLRVNITYDSSDQFHPDVTINPTNDEPYVSWEDDRNGNIDIYASSFGEYGATSTQANIPIRVYGTKRIGESPVIYEFDNTYTTDASGYLQLTVEWDVPGYTIELVAASTTKNMVMSEPSMPLPILPNSSADIYIYVD